MARAVNHLPGKHAEMLFAASLPRRSLKFSLSQVRIKANVFLFIKFTLYNTAQKM